MTKKLRADCVLRFYPLLRIEVVSSKKACKPGSLGYIYRVDVGHNIVKPVHVYFMRFGKKGKPRIANVTLYQNMLDFEHMDKELCEILKGRHYHYIPTADMILTKADSKNIDDMTSHEFACYVAAFAAYLSFLDGQNANLYRRGARTSRSLSIIDIIHFAEHMEEVNVINLHRVIQGSFDLGPVKDRYLYEYIRIFYDSIDNRSAHMEELYKELSIRKPGVERYSGQLHNSVMNDRAMALDILDGFVPRQRRPARLIKV